MCVLCVGREGGRRWLGRKAYAKGAVSLRQGKPERLAPFKVISVPTMRCGTPNLGGGGGVSSGDKSPGRRGTHTPRAARPPPPAVLSRRRVRDARSEERRVGKECRSRW